TELCARAGCAGYRATSSGKISSHPLRSKQHSCNLFARHPALGARLPSHRIRDSKVLMPALHVIDAHTALLDLSSQVTNAAARFDASVFDRDTAANAVRGWSTIVHAGEAAPAMAAARVG